MGVIPDAHLARANAECNMRDEESTIYLSHIRDSVASEQGAWVCALGGADIVCWIMDGFNQINLRDPCSLKR